MSATPEALRLADEQETALLAVANGEMQPGKLPLEPFVKGAALLRSMHHHIAQLEAERAAPATVPALEQIPDWAELSERVDAGLPLSPLEQFVYDNEEATPNVSAWRQSIIDMIAHYAAPQAGQDPDGKAFRTAAWLGLTLRFYGGCAQSSLPGTPSAYEVAHGGDRATAMREAVGRAATVIADGGETHQEVEAQTGAAPAADALDDSALLDAMERKRIAVVPEYEGPWDAEVYNDDGQPSHIGSGPTPREALRAAIAAQADLRGG